MDRFDGRLDFVLVRTGPRGAHAGPLSLAGDLETANRQLQLVRSLDEAELGGAREQVADLKAGETLAATPRQILSPGQRVGELTGPHSQRQSSASGTESGEERTRFFLIDES